MDKRKEDDMNGITDVTTRCMGKSVSPLERAIGEEFRNYLQEQRESELERRERYMEEAGEAFKRWFGDFPYHFEEGEMTQNAGIGAPIKILVLRSGETRLFYQMTIGYNRFNLVRACDNCGNIFLDPNSWITNLRTLAIEVKKEGKWYCARCDC